MAKSGKQIKTYEHNMCISDDSRIQGGKGSDFEILNTSECEHHYQFCFINRYWNLMPTHIIIYRVPQRI